MSRSIAVTQSSMPPFEEYCDEIKELWDSHWLTNMGIKCQTLHKQLKEYLDCPNMILYTNGHLWDGTSEQLLNFIRSIRRIMIFLQMNRSRECQN